MIQTTTIQTHGKTDVINVTVQAAQLIGAVTDGIALFSVPHTTAALLLCEDDEELRADLVKAAESLLAPLRPFRHNRNNNPNAEAHLISSLAGATLTVAIENGKLELGTYQNVLLLEMDGPKQRVLRCKVIQG
jgi:secondary thiamine-phosphate synthase enzyme